MARSLTVSRSIARLILIVSAFAAPIPLKAQQTITGPTPAAATPQSVAPSGTVPANADLRPTARLSNHLPTWAQPANDAGPIPDASVLHLDLLLTRPAARQAAFDHVLTAQQDPQSPLYHAWLTPTQIGFLYGPAQSDLDALTTWLTAQGLQVDEVTPSQTFIRVSAPATSVARAFSTSFRIFTLADGRQLRSATTEPAIPTAFTGLIAGIHGLSAPPEIPTGHGAPAPLPGSSTGLHPQYTTGSGNHYLTPGDFNTIYDVPATLTSGAGQRIAVIGRSQVNPLDVTNFQALIGQPAKLPNTIIAVANGNPGQSGDGDQLEATLDVQRTLGEVPGAQTDLVIASNNYGGISTAAQYNVQTLLDPVMNISFGACEANVSYANVEFWTALFSQAAAEGISTFVSASDSGVDTCAQDFTTPPATQIASINYICSSGFATCVGGTEFAEAANPAPYWATTNAPGRSSALSYIPEGVWNEPTTGNPPVFQIAGGGGGVSIYTPKPAFQAGPGVPADGFRDVPDLSFSSSAHDGYFACYTLGGYPCAVGPTGSFSFGYFYGTSDAAPGMASITAMLNQQQGSRQGNINPLLYRLAATPANGAFHDITVASSGATNCTAAIPSLCNNSTPSPTALTGGQPGYVLTAGYDQASGLGSLDVAKFLASAASSGAPVTLTLTGSSGSIPTGQNLSFSVTVSPVTTSSATPTGTIQFFANGNPLGAAVTLSAGKASITSPDSLPIGSNLITASYYGDATFSPSNSNALALTVAAGTTPSATLVTSNPNPTVTNQFTIITITVSPAAGSGTTPGGNVTLLRNNLLYSTSPLYKGSASFKVLLSAATYNFSASYTGDGTYAASISPALQLVSAPGASTTTLSGATSLFAGSTLTVTATVSNVSPASFFSFVTFLDGTTILGTSANGTTVNGSGNYSVGVTYTGNTPLSTGVHSITAVYNGDLNTQGSTSVPLVIAVGIPQAITVTPAPTSLTLTAGATTANTSVLTVASAGAFAGNVTFACTVAYTGTAAATFPPTCSLSAASVALASQGTATTTLTIGTTLPHSQPASGRAEARNPTLWHPAAGIVLALFAWIPFALKPGKRSRRKLAGVLTTALLATGLLALSACAGKSTSTVIIPTPIPTPTPLVGTTPGPYVITVVSSGTGTGTVSATTTIALTVQ